MLLEAVFAIFLLLAAILLFAALFQRTSQIRNSQSLLEQQTAYGEDLFDQIRFWAQDPSHYDSDWSEWNGRTFECPDNAAVQARVECLPEGLALASPSSRLEEMWPEALRCRLDKAVVPVQLTVTAPYQKPLLTVSYIASPRRDLATQPQLTVSLAAGTDPLARDGDATYEVELRDSGGNPVPSPVYDWYLLPRTGNATLVRSSASRTGRQMTIRNRIKLPGGITGYAPGEVDLVVKARYHGMEVTNGDPPGTRVRLQ